MPSLDSTINQEDSSITQVEDSEDYKYFLEHTMTHTVERLKPLEE